MSGEPQQQKTGLIELRLREIGQLFNSMDPSPFHDKDLDDDAEAFIVEWAEDFPADLPLRLVIHVEKDPADLLAHAQVREAIHHYFSYRVERNRRKLRALLKTGRTSLLVGLSFLALCLGASDLVKHFWSGAAAEILSESLYIGGWVAMWRPLEIYLYDWWPIQRMGRVYQKLSEIEVDLRQGNGLELPNAAMRKLVNGNR